MEELERKRLHWQKVTAVVCILLLIVVTASSALAFVGVRRYAPRIEHIVSRLDSVTAELDALDAQRLVDTVNGLTGELEKAQLADTLDSLRTISAQLEKVDWAALEQSTGDMLAQAQKSLAAAEEALTAVNDAAEKLDVEGLNTAVTELLAVMQPLAEFFARFKTRDLLYFADVDNTVTRRGILSDEKKRFFNGWALSDRVVLSTGKIYKSIEKTARELGVDKNPCCCLNGAVLYDGRGGREIVAKLGEKARLAARILREKGLPYVLYYPDALRVETPLGQKDYENLLRYDEMYLDEKGETDFKRVVKLLAFVDEGDSESEAIVDGAAAAIGLKALRTAPHSYEIVPPLADKGRALKITAKRLGVHFRMTAAVGDSMNDLELIQTAALGVAMGGGSPELARQADRICPSVEEDGVAQLLEELGLA